MIVAGCSGLYASSGDRMRYCTVSPVHHRLYRLCCGAGLTLRFSLFPVLQFGILTNEYLRHYETLRRPLFLRPRRLTGHDICATCVRRTGPVAPIVVAGRWTKSSERSIRLGSASEQHLRYTRFDRASLSHRCHHQLRTANVDYIGDSRKKVPSTPVSWLPFYRG